MAVIVHIPNNPNPIHGVTHTVSATGAMIIIKDALTEGAKISLENPHTKNQVEARVVRPPQLTEGGYLFPVEFLTKAPEFWAIVFPPSVN
jgi:hypothetical protein